MNSRKTQLELIDNLLNIMDELRLKCPWDKKQTFESLRVLTIEETHELSEAIIDKDSKAIKSELGDLLLHIVFYSKIASENKQFDIGDVSKAISEKLINRHPHIYKNTKVYSEKDVKQNWEALKLKEGNDSIFSGIPNSLPEIIKSQRIQDKASGVGFEWKKTEHVWNKVKEEEKELINAINLKNKISIEEEFGDLFFSLINYSRFIKIDPELALKKANKKFINRFKHIEKKIKSQNESIYNMSLNDFNILWKEAKNKV